MSAETQSTILLMGGSGFIGSALGQALAKQGHTLRLVTRSPERQAGQQAFPCQLFTWDGKNLPADALRGADAVVNLVGQGIADKAWSPSYRNKILNSRLDACKALLKALAQLDPSDKPQVVVQASAIGYYSDQTSEQEHHESAAPGQGFLSDVCQQWEASAAPIKEHCRLVTLRIGLVLGWFGGAFPKLWDLYCSGVGSVLGHGRQWMNWIHIDDMVGVILQSINDQRFQGTINAVAPGNHSNQEFHRQLSARSPSLTKLVTPALALKTVLGKRSDMLLEGGKVLASRLEAWEFPFRYPQLSAALEQIFSQVELTNCHVLARQQWVPHDQDKVWEFMSKATNLARITPANMGFEIVEGDPANIGANSQFTYKVNVRGLSLTWKSLITSWEPKRYFTDLQTKGPYDTWFHHHIFEPMAGGMLITDVVEYRLPFFPLGQAALWWVQKDLDRIFQYRREKLPELLNE